MDIRMEGGFGGPSGGFSGEGCLLAIFVFIGGIVGGVAGLILWLYVITPVFGDVEWGVWVFLGGIFVGMGVGWSAFHIQQARARGENLRPTIILITGVALFAVLMATLAIVCGD